MVSLNQIDIITYDLYLHALVVQLGHDSIHVLF